MIGRFLSKVVKVVTLPLDAANAAVDIAVGGTGSKQSRMRDPHCSPGTLLEQLRDKVADSAKSIDE
jgi:hypothetical protein